LIIKLFVVRNIPTLFFVLTEYSFRYYTLAENPIIRLGLGFVYKDRQIPV
jgi:hypothetical protein